MSHASGTGLLIRPGKPLSDTKSMVFLRYNTYLYSLSPVSPFRFNYNPNVRVPPKHFDPPHIDGGNRYKYFRRPIIPFLPQMPPNVVLAPARYSPRAQTWVQYIEYRSSTSPSAVRKTHTKLNLSKHHPRSVCTGDASTQGLRVLVPWSQSV